MLFLAIRKRIDGRDEGFTLIELLVVVIIIGILAAIAIPAFLNQRTRAWEAAAESTLRNAATAQESWYTENDAYTANTADLVTEGWTDEGTTTLTIEDADANEYCMEAVHTNGGDMFSLDSADGEITRGVACT